MDDFFLKRLKRLVCRFQFQKKCPSEESCHVSGVHYSCDVCHCDIPETTNRYTCGECEESYDLCSACYGNGEGTNHTEARGHLHELHLETRNNLAACQLVIVDTLEETVQNMFYYFAERPCIGIYVPTRNRYEYLKFKEVGEMVLNFGYALHSVLSAIKSPEKSPMLAVCSVVRLEWYIVDYACCLLGIPTVGITASCDQDTILFILNQTKSEVAVCSIDLYPIFLSLAEGACLAVKEIVVMDLNQNAEFDSSTLVRPLRSDLKVSLFSNMVFKGGENPVDITKFKTDPEAIYTIAYTSGSTGNPKGCVFLRKTWLGHMKIPLVFLFGTKRVWFSFQPPSHMMERETFHITLITGNKAGIYRGTMEHLFEDMRMVRPTVITSTPRFYAAVYNDYLQDLYKEYVISLRECSTQAASTEKTNRIHSSDLSNQYLLTCSPADFDLKKVPRDVKYKVKEKFTGYFGGRERVIAVGGAAVPKELKEFLTFCFDASVVEGYGTTEAGGICNGDWSMGDVTIRLRDVPDMGYFTTDKPPRGEICVKTKNMISGYYKNEEETEEKFQNGFFCTGDIGIMDTPGHVVVVDRKKNIFKLAQGEFVAPERIEGVFESLSNLVEQAALFQLRQNHLNKMPLGTCMSSWEDHSMESYEQDTEKSFHIRHIDEQLFDDKQTCGKNQPSQNELEAICHIPEVYDLYLSEMRNIGQANGLQGWEIPSAIILESCPFSDKNHLLTSTLKKSRPQLEKKYKERLEQLYEDLTFSSTIVRSIEEDIFGSFLKELSKLRVPVNSESIENFSAPSSAFDLTLSIVQMGGDSLTAMRLSNLIKKYLFQDVPAMMILKKPLNIVLEHLVAALSSETDRSLSGNVIDSNFAEVNWDEETDVSFIRSMPFVCNYTPESLHGKKVVVLLTGATGFLGQYLLWEILMSDQVIKVICLTRRLSGLQPIDRVSDVVSMMLKEFSNVHKNDTEQLHLKQLLDKVQVLESDISKTKLGLSENDYILLKSEVDFVIHNGAHVNHILTYRDLKESNVSSTKEILKLCRDTRSKVLHYVSTIGIFPASTQDNVTEKSIPDKCSVTTLSGYSQSKWVSEKMIIDAVEEGLLSNYSSISRPGLIGAHSKSGRPNSSDWFYALVQGIKSTKQYPTGGSWDKGCIHIVPVDIVARSIIALTLNALSDEDKHTSHTSLGVYHLLNTVPQASVSLKDIVTSLNKICKLPLSPARHSDFLSLLAEESDKNNPNPVLVRLSLLLHDGCPFVPYIPSITNENTQLKLISIGIDINSLSTSYMAQYLEFLVMNEKW